jgi:hypothetical protein
MSVKQNLAGTMSQSLEVGKTDTVAIRTNSGILQGKDSSGSYSNIALLDGRTGGQQLTGGIGINDNLTLVASSHGTPGNVLINDGVVIANASGDSLVVDTTALVVDNSGSIVIGAASATASSILDVQSTTGAFIPPRMTTTQRNALTPTNGMMLYNSTLNRLEGYQNGSWGWVGTTTFAGLTDVDGSFANAGAIYAVNGATDGVDETTVILSEGTNTFAITKGTASLDIAAGSTLDVNANLTVSTAVTLDQSVASGSSPTFTADNFSDGGGNAIITTTQETNFEAAYTHISSNGSDHTYINQDLTTTASPTFAALTLTGTLEVNGHSAFGNDSATPQAANTIVIWESITSTSTFSSVDSWLTINPSSDTSATYNGFNQITLTSGANNFSGDIVGFRTSAWHNGSGTCAQVNGFRVLAKKTGTGNTTNVYGALYSTGNENATGDITNNSVIYIETPITTGNITNNRGIQIENIVNGTSVNYAIDTGLGDIQFGDDTYVLGDFDVVGNSAYGDATVSSNFLMDLDVTFTLTSGGAYGQRVITRLNPASNSSAIFGGENNGLLFLGSVDYTSWCSAYYSASTMAGTGNIAYLVGNTAEVNGSTAGTSTNAFSYYASSTLSNGTHTNHSLFYGELYDTGGTFTNTHGLHIIDYSSGAETRTNFYGIKVENIDGASSINSAITTGLGDVTFGDDVYCLGDLDITGHVGVGTSSPVSNISLDIGETYTGTSGDLIGTRSTVAINPSGSSSANYFSSSYSIYTLGSNNITGSVNCFGGTALHLGSGTVDNFNNAVFTVTNASGVITNSRALHSRSTYTGSVITTSDIILAEFADTGGTSTDIYLFRGIDSSSGTTITNKHGLSLGNITGGTSSNYSIKTGLGDIQFGDDVYCLGDLDVVGTITGTIAASDVSIETTGSPTVDQLQEFIYTIGHAGRRSGGEITDAGGGTIDVALGEGMLRTTDSETGVLRTVSWSNSLGTSIPAGTIRYVFIEWNGGSPQVAVRSSETTNWNTEFMLGSVANEGGTLHILNNPQNLADFGGRLLERSYETMPLQYATRVGGLSLSEKPGRYIYLTPGELYDRGNEFDITLKDTSVADTFDSYSSAGLESSANTQWDNNQFDNGGTLTVLTNNRWAVHWWFVESDDSLVMVYGSSQYVSSAAAEQESIPSTLPLRLQMHGKLIAKAVFQKGASSYAVIESALETQFSSLLASDHNNLSTLQGGTTAEYYHLTSSEHTELTDWLDDVTLGSTGNLDLGASTFTINSIEIVGSDGEVNKAAVEDSANWDSAYTHISNNGTDHSYIDQDVTNGANVTFGNIAGTLTTAAQGNITSLGTLTSLNVSGDSSLDGSVVINESGLNKDFRVESLNSSSAIFVNGGSDRIGIFNISPSTSFHVNGLSLFNDTVTLSSGLDVNGHAAIGSSVSIDANTVLTLSETTTSLSTSRGFYSVLTVSASGASSASYRASEFKVETSGSQNYTGSIQGARFVANVSGSGTSSELVGNQISVYKWGTGNLSTSYGVNLAMGNANATGSITTVNGFYLQPITVTGTVVNAYGLRLSNITGASTINSAITTGLGDVTLGDDVYVLGDLDVVGHSAFGGNGAVSSGNVVTISETTTTTNSFYGINCSLSIDPSAPTANSYFAGYDGIALQGANSVSGSVDGHRYFIQNYNTGTTATIRGMSVFVEHWAASGTTTNNIGFDVYSGNVIAGGTITNNTSIKIESPSTTGTIINARGLQVLNITGASTINYAIETGLGDVQLGDDVYVLGDLDIVGFCDIGDYLRVDQGADDDHAIRCVSSDIAHGLVGVMPTDQYFGISKLSGTGGGTLLSSATDGDETSSIAFQVDAYCRDTADTTESTAGVGVITFNSFQHDGADTESAVAADGNIAVFQNNSLAQLIIKGDGDVEANGTVTSGSFDFAEYMETYDGNNIQPGTPVVIDHGRFVRTAERNEEPFGVVSATAGFVCNNPMEWHDKYCRDNFGGYIRDSKGNKVLNDNFDPNKKYKKRSDRKEWVVVGFIGQVYIKNGAPVNKKWVRLGRTSDESSLWIIK